MENLFTLTDNHITFNKNITFTTWKLTSIVSFIISITMAYKYINPEYIESVAGGDRETIMEIAGLFREQVSEVLTDMRKLYEVADYYNLGLLAHKAKSSVAIMGMSDLAAMLKNFELQAKDGINPENYSAYISRFENETAEALKELDSYITSI